MKKIDWILLISYLLINLITGLIYILRLYDQELIKEFYFVIPFVFVFLIFDVFHKRFWNNRILLIWGFIGILQLVFYYYYKDLPEFQAVNGNYLQWLKALPLTIIISYIFNFINKKIYGDNFIVTALRLTPNKIDPEGDRLLRPADYIFSISGFMIIIVGTII